MVNSNQRYVLSSGIRKWVKAEDFLLIAKGSLILGSLQLLSVTKYYKITQPSEFVLADLFQVGSPGGTFVKNEPLHSLKLGVAANHIIKTGRETKNVRHKEWQSRQEIKNH